MKFTVHSDIHSLGRLEYNPDDYSNATPQAKLEVSVSPGYVELLTAEEWDRYQALLGAREYKAFRNEFIGTFVSGWATMSVINKQASVRHYVWPSGTTITELNTLYTPAERARFKRKAMRNLESLSCMPRKSSVVGSKKYFNIMVNDAGILTNTEIISDTVL